MQIVEIAYRLQHLSLVDYERLVNDVLADANTPTQALLLLNEPEYLKAAGKLAVKVLEQPQGQRLDFAWETVTARLPDQKEKAVLQKLIVDLKDKYSANGDLADKLCQDIELPADKLDSGEKAAEAKMELAAWTVVGNVLHNLDITKTKD